MNEEKKNSPTLDWETINKEMTTEGMKVSFEVNRQYALSKDRFSATINDNFLALAIAIRDRVVERWINTQQRYHRENVRRVYYLSMEFLIGRLLGNYMYNLGLEDEVRQAMQDLELDLEKIREQELDAGLGNGGLGRLAACFLDSMATLGIPAYGYGIRYDYGIFHQKIRDGYQIELPDQWLRHGSPWEFSRPEYKVKVRYYGRVEMRQGSDGRQRAEWIDTQDVLAVPYDIPIPGYQNNVVNTLRLWSARSTEEFDLEIFNQGDYQKAVHKKIVSEEISKVLYPRDDMRQGKELRLKQEYFFTSAAISDIIRRFMADNKDLNDLPKKVAIQLNDTHPAIGVVELMRILIDHFSMEWDNAWQITRQVFAYTNHTLMPEAMERWSVRLMEKVLPRHMQIIYEINSRFLKEVEEKYPGDIKKLRKMSVIEEGEPKKVRMANLAIVGSYSINGVSKLHTDLLRQYTFRDLHEFFPQKINNKTNGITQRRWLLKANPLLSKLISDSIGEKWVVNLNEIQKILPLKDDAYFREKWKQIKDSNKKQLAQYIKQQMSIEIDPQSMFDVQVKRIHEYKRQLLFAFYMIAEYLRLKNEPSKFIQPRTFIVGGKAAPAYSMAKLIIKFINSIAAMINNDPAVGDRLKVIFLENYRVSLAERIFPASDLSEQISTAGTEASGTGNMKFMLNGALTIGTLDGANIEISDLVGEENIFIFGLKSDEVTQLRKRGYNPQEYIDRSPLLKEIIQMIDNNAFCPHELDLFHPLIDYINKGDYFCLCADFDFYLQKQNHVSSIYQDQQKWITKSIINVAHAGPFSSDRTIMQYAKDIWKIELDIE